MYQGYILPMSHRSFCTAGLRISISRIIDVQQDGVSIQLRSQGHSNHIAFPQNNVEKGRFNNMLQMLALLGAIVLLKPFSSSDSSQSPTTPFRSPFSLILVRNSLPYA